MDKNQQQKENFIHENSKNKDLESYRADHGEELLTTNQGVRVSHTDDSLKAGNRGPTLMEDFHFREKLTHFDHERIPERVVHARGFGVHGYFQVYEPITEYTKAKFLQDPSVKTPVFVRFSTVVGSRGSADTVRDVRGFATKFYTEEGNYDLVANNIPVFFIQDAIKFPDVVHAIKPEPHNEIPQASAAHDTFWDFVVNTPETAHMIMWLLSDRAIPRSFRMMEGFGVNTFRFVNQQGKARFVKFHWKPLLGVHSLVWDEAQKLAGKDPDYHRRDLWEAINMGEYPEYELGVQMIEEEEEFNFNFDILDPTKIWPEEIVPVKRIGKMTLDGNVDNFFAETEQVAFHPGHVVPGIDFSNDPLLQGRLFSYLDTQLIRLGGPNFHEIAINRPIAPIHNNQRDGYHRMTIDCGSVSYSPNSLQANAPMPASEAENGYVHYQEKVEGQKVRQRNESFNDHFSQATLFWNSMSSTEKQHIVEAFHFEVGSVMDKEIKQRVVDMFNNVDGQLAVQIAAGIGAMPPKAPMIPTVTNQSPAVSQENTIKDARSRKVAILLENGFNHTEISQVMESLAGAGVQTEIISKNLGMLTSVEGQQLEVGKNYVTTGSIKYDGLYIPGGQQSVSTLTMQGEALHFINETFKHAKTIGATSEGVDLLMASAIQGVAMAGADTQDQLMSEMGVVTIRNASDINTFTQEFINAIAQHRHWIRQNKKQMIPA
ncbi:catalase [Natronincola peptidivorans]|uniref:Catalase n=1 Tax=Natronincola peptidivorans TaxID=426128 RepID=A0A1I0G299_9FIRM|nr:catalase [Natronincola peptidivorans]SET64808.1 catalase [Natronincola peptidivorans]